MSTVSQTAARAGFWRRFGAFLLDMAIVLVPLQLVVVVLFALTGGAVQGSFGVAGTLCRQVTTLPEGLVPPPPEGANNAVACRLSFFGLPTANLLHVSAITTNGALTTTVTQTYTLDANGRLNAAVSLDFVAWIALVLYIVALEAWRGATLGKSVTRIRTVRLDQPERAGIGVKTAVMREVVKDVPLIVNVVALLWLTANVPNPPDRLYHPLFLICIGFMAAWMIWIVIDIARKRDPIYDRLAGSAVLRRG